MKHFFGTTNIAIVLWFGKKIKQRHEDVILFRLKAKRNPANGEV